jgi:hypothetical protein
VIISDMVKRDTSALLRRAPGLVEDKKEALSFSACLNLFKIGDASAFVTK